jgi:hypothetical protein
MRLFRCDAEVGRPITAFGSIDLTMTPIARPAGFVQVGCMRLGAGGVLGYHQATIPQLFVVVDGAGWVRGEAPERYPIAAGQAAFWQADEWHESGTETGITAMVLEADELDPAQYLREIPLT